MRIEAIEELRCPTCLGELGLKTFTDSESGGETYVETGVLLCDSCKIEYPIEAYTPVLLRFSTEFHDWFAREHAAALTEFCGYSMPNANPRPGETAVQETFTDEWNLTTEDELSFSYTAEQLVDLNRKVWLRWVAESPPEDRPRRVLDAGCGAGMETQALRECTGAEQTFGIDLNFSILSRRETFRRQPDMHFVVASLHDLPFPRESFDLVYCQGVLMITYSSTEGFRSLARRVSLGGHLFVWLYGLEDRYSADGRQSLWQWQHHWSEAFLRPLISRAPRPIRNAIFKILTRLSHLRPRGGTARLNEEMHGDRWKPENTEHQLRDWLSPRFARRHGFNEVMEWFEEAGFRVTDTQSPKAYRDLFGWPMFGVGMTGRRVGGQVSSASDERAFEDSAV